LGSEGDVSKSIERGEQPGEMRLERTRSDGWEQVYRLESVWENQFSSK
jgi:hypothetical protein